MRTKLSLFDRMMVAITFAELGEAETAKEFVAGVKPQSKRRTKTDWPTVGPEVPHGTAG